MRVEAKYLMALGLVAGLVISCSKSPASRARDNAKGDADAADDNDETDGAEDDGSADGDDTTEGDAQGDDGEGTVVEVGTFAVNAIPFKVGGRFTVGWKKSKNAEAYDITLTTDDACKTEVDGSKATETLLVHTFEGIEPGAYFVCVTATADGAEPKPADNQGLAVTVAPGWTTVSGASPLGTRSRGVAAFDGARVIVWGGFRPNTALTDGAIFDVKAETWTTMTQTNTPAKRFGPVAAWHGDHFYLLRGYSGDCGATCGVHKWNATTGEWSAISDTDAMPANVGYGSAVTHGDHIYTYGGFIATGGESQDFRRYDVKQDQWEVISTTSPPGTRQGHYAAASDKYLFIFGGRRGTTHLNDGYLYDFAAKTWKTVSTTGAPGVMAHGPGGFVAGKFVVMSGQAGNTDTGAFGGMYDPEKDEWSPIDVTGLGGRLVSAEVASTGDSLFIYGGFVSADSGVRDTTLLWRHE